MVFVVQVRAHRQPLSDHRVGDTRVLDSHAFDTEQAATEAYDRLRSQYAMVPGVFVTFPQEANHASLPENVACMECGSEFLPNPGSHRTVCDHCLCHCAQCGQYVGYPGGPDILCDCDLRRGGR